MKYSEVLALGVEQAYGFVKCTFAEIYDGRDRKLYSVQKRHTHRQNASLITDDKGNKSVSDLAPMVIADVTMSKALRENGRVPCRFTPEMREAILEGMANNKKLRDTWKKMRRWKVDYAPLGIKAGEVECVEELHNEPTRQELDAWTRSSDKKSEHYWLQPEYDFVLNKEYEELFNTLQKDEIIYVRPVAINWIPTVAAVTFMDGKKQRVEVDVNMDSTIEAARKRMETAKAILATAATLTII